ncbi:MAG: hypothetical protein MPJ50_05230 [Pirellulales bacterium]|nr:hypothetical protein [Pirellulales bacterium]
MTKNFSPKTTEGQAGNGQAIPVNLQYVDDAELERLIDRLVDNEVPQPLRRSLLVELDRRPQGWRRCALAFLEAQAWQSDVTSTGGTCTPEDQLFGGIFGAELAGGSDFASIHASDLSPKADVYRAAPVSRFRVASLADKSRHPSSLNGRARIKHFVISPNRREDAKPTPVHPSTDQQVAESKTAASKAPGDNETAATAKPFSRMAPVWQSPVGVVAAMGACFLLAFMLGLAVRETGDDSRVDAGHQTSNSTNSAANPANTNLTNSDIDNAQQNDASMQSLAANTNNVSGSGTWGTVSLASNGANPEASPLELPVVDGPSMKDWFSTMPPPVHPKTLAELRRTGHEVTTQTQWMTVRLEDGRFAVVPVDEVQVRYVGGNNVQ